MPNPEPAPVRRPRLLVVASTFPGHAGDGTPAFVASLAERESLVFDTLVLVPRIAGAPRRERNAYRIERFAYFPRRWERLADGAILENVRTHPWLRLQIPFFLVAEQTACSGHQPARHSWAPFVGR